MNAGAHELLAAIRSGARPPAAALAAFIAVRALAGEGTQPTGAAVIAATGYDHATLSGARAWLDEHVPAWRPTCTTSEARTSAIAAQHPSVELVEATEPAPAEKLAKVIHLAPPATHGHPCLTWRAALTGHRDAVVGRRSWDLFSDIYSKTADDVFAGGDIGDLIALTVDYVETVSGAKITPGERRRIAMLVRQYGKSVIYGLHEALPRIESADVNGAISYATAVARRTVEKIRAQEAQP